MTQKPTKSVHRRPIVPFGKPTGKVTLVMSDDESEIIVACDTGHDPNLDASIQAMTDEITEYYKSDIDRGRKVHAGAKAGHAALHGGSSAKAQRYSTYQNRVNELHRKNGRRSHWDICKSVAREFNVDPKTIQRHTQLK